MSKWTGELSVGNRMIDSGHKDLYGKIEALLHAACAKHGAGLAEALDEIEQGMLACFPVEERVAQAVHFDFGQHKLAHQQMLDKVRKIKNETASGNCPGHDFERHIRCLMDCLTRHIREESGSLRALLDMQYYDFKP